MAPDALALNFYSWPCKLMSGEDAKGNCRRRHRRRRRRCRIHASLGVAVLREICPNAPSLNNLHGGLFRVVAVERLSAAILGVIFVVKAL